MKAVIQRVSCAEVKVEDVVAGSIGAGMLVLLGVGRDDDDEKAAALAAKLAELRIFNDADGKMNCSIRDIGGAFLVVSQFTLYGDCRKGRRPSFDQAAEPAEAERLYERFVTELKMLGFPVATGRFRAMMKVSLVNEGPVTFTVDA